MKLWILLALGLELLGGVHPHDHLHKTLFYHKGYHKGFHHGYVKGYHSKYNKFIGANGVNHAYRVTVHGSEPAPTHVKPVAYGHVHPPARIIPHATGYPVKSHVIRPTAYVPRYVPRPHYVVPDGHVPRVPVRVLPAAGYRSSAQPAVTYAKGHATGSQSAASKGHANDNSYLVYLYQNYGQDDKVKVTSDQSQGHGKGVYKGLYAEDASKGHVSVRGT